MTSLDSEPTETPGKKRTRVSQTDVPRHDLQEAVRVARALEDHYAGGSASPMDIAASLDSTPSSSWFRTLTGAAIAYGLTEGGYNSDEIKLSDLGARAVAPTSIGEDAAAMREALMKPRVMREFLTKYNRKKLPPEHIARNVLASFGVDKGATERTLEVIVASARHAGALRTMKGDDWVDLRGPTRGHPQEDTSEDMDDGLDSDYEEATPGEGEPPTLPPDADRPNDAAQPKPIFVGHGKSRGPLTKVEEILKNFGIPYMTAVTEPSLGQPIPTKVKGVMKNCGSAILILTKDEKFVDADGGEVWRPSENVVYELGAASLAYDDRVVIFMEEGLTFPANFESIGHIQFEDGAIEAKTMDLIKELIGFGLLKVTPAG